MPQGVVNWDELHNVAQNGPVVRFSGEIEITIAEELAFGYFMRPYEVVVVKDTEGRVWFIYETVGCADGELRGLVSRYNVHPGMMLKLRVSGSNTMAFCITPETSQTEPRRINRSLIDRHMMP